MLGKNLDSVFVPAWKSIMIHYSRYLVFHRRLYAQQFFLFDINKAYLAILSSWAFSTYLM